MADPPEIGTLDPDDPALADFPAADDLSLSTGGRVRYRPGFGATIVGFRREARAVVESSQALARLQAIIEGGDGKDAVQAMRLLFAYAYGQPSTPAKSDGERDAAGMDPATLLARMEAIRPMLERLTQPRLPPHEPDPPRG